MFKIINSNIVLNNLKEKRKLKNIKCNFNKFLRI